MLSPQRNNGCLEMRFTFKPPCDVWVKLFTKEEFIALHAETMPPAQCDTKTVLIIPT